MSTITIRQDPIFIVGYPRSGTTLLQALLATQPNLCTFPETHFFTISSLSSTNQFGPLTEADKQILLRVIVENNGITFSEVEVHEIIQKPLTLKEMFEIVVVHYLAPQLNADMISQVRWLEKTPGHILSLNQLFDYYPQARFIHIIRDPIPAIYSRKQKFQRDRTSSVTRLAKDWKKAIITFEEFLTSHPSHAVTLRYEDLIQNPVKELRQLCDFSSIEFDEERIHSYKDVSTNIILPYETWKLGVTSDTLRSTNNRYNPSIAELLRIQHLLNVKMRSYGYEVRQEQLQIVYDIFRKVASRSLELFSRWKRLALNLRDFGFD